MLLQQPIVTLAVIDNDGCMTYDFTSFQQYFSHTGKWEGENERLVAMELHLH